jgi:hypothetical protein
MKDKEKEIKYLIYLKSELIRQTKKELRQLKLELQREQKQKKLK